MRDYICDCSLFNIIIIIYDNFSQTQWFDFDIFLIIILRKKKAFMTVK